MVIEGAHEILCLSPFSCDKTGCVNRARPGPCGGRGAIPVLPRRTVRWAVIPEMLERVQQAICWARILSIVCSTDLCIARPRDGVKHYLYSFSEMKYPVAAEFLLLPGICDGSIQEIWSHDCPVGLSFGGLFQTHENKSSP